MPGRLKVFCVDCPRVTSSRFRSSRSSSSLPFERMPIRRSFWTWGRVSVEWAIDLFRERSLRYLFPDISTRAHLEFTVRLVATGRVRVKPTITHVLHGISEVPKAFEITANKGKYQAINPAQVMMRS